MKRRKKWFRALVRQRFLIIFLLFLQIALVAVSVVYRSGTSRWIRYGLYVISIAVALHVVAKRDKGSFKLTWVFTILLIPLFGGPLYLCFWYQTHSKRLQRRVSHIESIARAVSPPRGDSYSSLAVCMPEQARQTEYLDRFAGFPVYENTETVFYTPAERAYADVLAALESAEKYIFIEFFIIEEGKMWGGILDVLKRKAAQGVDVRVLYDDIGCFLRLPKDYAKRLSALGIRCMVFNRFRPYFTALQNSRDHRKIIAIDGKIAFTGGFNLADEYINVTHPLGHWKDAGVRLTGDAAWEFARIFLQMWMYISGRDEDVASYLPRAASAPSDGYVQPYSDAPYDAENVSEQIYLHMINTARRYLYINTPYLILDESMISALSLAAKSGVDIRIVLPYHYDKAFVHFTTRSYYRELIRDGVRIYEYSEGFMHAKTFVSDDTVATVGTANLDFRSLYLQYECGVRLCGCRAVRAIAEDFLATLPLCHEIREAECRGNVLTRFLQDIMRLFAPLM